MTKYDKQIEKSYEKDFQRAKKFFLEGRIDKAESLLKKIYKYYDSKNNYSKTNEILKELTDLYTKSRQEHKALEYYEKLHDFYKKTKRRHQLGIILNNLGIIHKSLSNLEKSKECFIISREIFEEIKFDEGIFKAIANLGITLDIEGKLEESLNITLKAKKICLKNNYLHELPKIYSTLTILYFRLNDHDNFIKNLEIAAKLFENSDDYHSLVFFYNNIAAYAERFNDDEKEVEFLNKALETSNKFNVGDAKVHTLSNYSQYLIKKRKIKQAEEFLTQASKICESKKYLLYFVELIYAFGLASYIKGNFQEAIKKVNEALKIAKENGQIHWIIDCYKLLGEIFKKYDDFYESYRNYTQALNYYQDISNSINTLELKESSQITLGVICPHFSHSTAMTLAFPHRLQ